jgi:hypothetical protein
MLTDLERLVAIEDIRFLKARRDRSVDQKDWVLYESFHTPDFISFGIGRADWASAREATEQAAKALEGKISVHHSVSPAITIHSPTEASAIWTMKDYIVSEQDGVQRCRRGYGYYDETYVKVGGEWKFKTRTLSRVWSEEGEV